MYEETLPFYKESQGDILTRVQARSHCKVARKDKRSTTESNTSHMAKLIQDKAFLKEI